MFMLLFHIMYEDHLQQLFFTMFPEGPCIRNKSIPRDIRYTRSTK